MGAKSATGTDPVEAKSATGTDPVEAKLTKGSVPVGAKSTKGSVPVGAKPFALRGPQIIAIWLVVEEINAKAFRI